MRILILVVLLAVVGCLALPLSAFFLDGSDTGEALIVPVQVLVTAAVGALLGGLLLDRSHPPRRRALTGAAVGVLGALVGIGVFFALLSGFDGA